MEISIANRQTFETVLYYIESKMFKNNSGDVNSYRKICRMFFSKNKIDEPINLFIVRLKNTLKKENLH